MRDDDGDDIDKRPYHPELVAMLAGSIKAKARILAVFLSVCVGVFIWMAKDVGQPIWLVVAIGVLGAVLLAFLIVLVWFWLRFLSRFRDAGVSSEEPRHSNSRDR